MLLLHSHNERWGGGKPPCLLVIGSTSLLNMKLTTGGKHPCLPVIGGERRDKAFRSWAVDSVIAFWQGANWHRRTPVQVDYSMISLSG